MSAPRILQAAEKAGYWRFASMLQTAGFAELLGGPGPFTMFAPNDAAFEKFSAASLDKLMAGDRDLLRLVTGYHFAAGKVMAARFAGKRIRAVMHAGGEVMIDGKLAVLRVNTARVIEPDVAAQNGIIHGIDTLLWPREPSLAAVAM